ncbi:MAG: hypothetical protein MUF64_30810 [Polyangiaceae bacterium]|jgi:hypothetical protein|nr:hypothetical protein [Polyangiaceae bacterium]
MTGHSLAVRLFSSNFRGKSACNAPCDERALFAHKGRSIYRDDRSILNGVTTRISKEQAAAFRQRWALVEEAERQELQNTSVELRFRQLVSMFDSARALGWATTDETELEQVRARWAKLRRWYLG